MSLWLAGRGTSPGSISASRSGHSSRRRRGATPDPPSSGHSPSTNHGILHPATSHRRPAAQAPAHQSPSSRRRRRRHRRGTAKKEQQKSTARSPPHQQPRQDKLVTDPPPDAAKPATNSRSGTALFTSATRTIAGDKGPKQLRLTSYPSLEADRSTRRLDPPPSRRHQGRRRVGGRQSHRWKRDRLRFAFTVEGGERERTREREISVGTHWTL